MNGWTNAKIWQAFTYISNTESAYSLSIEFRNAAKGDAERLAKMLRLTFGETNDDVNWVEIAEAMYE